jgi:hypothetical protein
VKAKRPRFRRIAKWSGLVLSLSGLLGVLVIWVISVNRPILLQPSLFYEPEIVHLHVADGQVLLKAKAVTGLDKRYSEDAKTYRLDSSFKPDRCLRDKGKSFSFKWRKH